MFISGQLRALVCLQAGSSTSPCNSADHQGKGKRMHATVHMPLKVSARHTRHSSHFMGWNTPCRLGVVGTYTPPISMETGYWWRVTQSTPKIVTRRRLSCEYYLGKCKQRVTDLTHLVLYVAFQFWVSLVVNTSIGPCSCSQHVVDVKNRSSKSEGRFPPLYLSTFQFDTN